MIKSLPRWAHTLKHFLIVFITLNPALAIVNNHKPLQIQSVHVPSPAVTGDSVRLRCMFDLGNETLYAVKWYRNMREFFRYVPAANPPLKTFPQVGVDVDMGYLVDSPFPVHDKQCVEHYK